MKIIYWEDEDGNNCPMCHYSTNQKFHLEGEPQEDAQCGTCFCMSLLEMEAEVKIND